MKPEHRVFDYDNYRLFLRDIFEQLKAKDAKFSFRFFARVAGFKSHNTLWNVINGRSNLTATSAEKIAKGLKLNREETQYFGCLVSLNQAKSSEEKLRFSTEILKSRAYKKTHPLSEAQYSYYTHWYYVVIREMVNLPEFDEKPEWIASHILPSITPAQASEAVEHLVRLNLLRRDEAGRLVQTNTIVSTPDEVTSGLIAQFHREFMKKAAESIDLIARQDRDISAVTFRVSAETAKKIKEKIQNFRRELVMEAASDGSADSIFQLNLQLFPVTLYVSTKIKGGHNR